MKFAEAKEAVKKIFKRCGYEGKLSDRALRGCAEVYIDYLEEDGEPGVAFGRAPNHRASNLDDAQWLLVRTDAFFRWFGRSVVTDENGEPRVMWHGSSKEIKTFKPERILVEKSRMTLWSGPGFYFTGSKQTAKIYAKNGIEPMPVFLRLEKPLVVDETGNAEKWSEHITRRQAELIFADGDNDQWLDHGIIGDLMRMDDEDEAEAARNGRGNGGGKKDGGGSGIRRRTKMEYKAMSRAQRVALYVSRLKTDVVKLKMVTSAFGAKSQRKLLESICRHTDHDGVVHTIAPGVVEYVVYDPAAIKSATGNDGEYSRTKECVMDAEDGAATDADSDGGSAGTHGKTDDEDGRWITTEEGHRVHIDAEGNPDKGNPHVLEKMTGGGGGGDAPGEWQSQNAEWRTRSGWTFKPPKEIPDDVVSALAAIRPEKHHVGSERHGSDVTLETMYPPDFANWPEVRFASQFAGDAEALKDIRNAFFMIHGGHTNSKDYFQKYVDKFSPSTPPPARKLTKVEAQKRADEILKAEKEAWNNRQRINHEVGYPAYKDNEEWKRWDAEYARLNEARMNLLAHGNEAGETEESAAYWDKWKKEKADWDAKADERFRAYRDGLVAKGNEILDDVAKRRGKKTIGEMGVDHYAMAKEGTHDFSADDKLIFVDFDGVLTDEDHGYMTGRDPKKYSAVKKCADVLKEMSDRTGAKIVLATNWRKRGREEGIDIWTGKRDDEGNRVKEHFKNPIPALCDILEDRVVGFLPKGPPGGMKADAYKEWKESHPEFAGEALFIDDKTAELSAYGKAFPQSKTIKTNSRTGLVGDDVEKACGLLGESATGNNAPAKDKNASDGHGGCGRTLSKAQDGGEKTMDKNKVDKVVEALNALARGKSDTAEDAKKKAKPCNLFGCFDGGPTGGDFSNPARNNAAVQKHCSDSVSVQKDLCGRPTLV